MRTRTDALYTNKELLDLARQDFEAGRDDPDRLKRRAVEYVKTLDRVWKYARTEQDLDMMDQIQQERIRVASEVFDISPEQVVLPA